MWYAQQKKNIPCLTEQLFHLYPEEDAQICLVEHLEEYVIKYRVCREQAENSFAR